MGNSWYYRTLYIRFDRLKTIVVVQKVLCSGVRAAGPASEPRVMLTREFSISRAT